MTLHTNLSFETATGSIDYPFTNDYMFRAILQKDKQVLKALIAALEKPERKLVLRIIDAQNYITEQTSLDSFIAGFELAWRLSIELQNDENERSFSCRTRRTDARFV